MHSYTLFSLVVLLTTQVLADCDDPVVFDKCIEVRNEYLTTCQRVPTIDYGCLCQRTKEKGQCFDQCKQDAQKLGEQKVVYAEAETYCKLAPPSPPPTASRAQQPGTPTAAPKAGSAMQLGMSGVVGGMMLMGHIGMAAF